MKKITISMVFLGLGSIFAESIDEEIERLEKENKLLELKQKQQVLQKDLEQGRITNSNNAIEKPLPKDYTKQKEKNGFFLGVEAELGSVEYLRTQISTKLIDQASFSDTNITFNGGLLLGYQHYFGANAKHGIKVSSHLYSGIGYGFKNTRHERKEEEVQILPPPSPKEKEVYEIDKNFSHSFIPIKFGVDIKYLYDFLEKEKHVLGLNAGVGYEVDYYISDLSLKFSNFKFNGVPESNNLDWQYLKTNDLLTQGAYFTIGLHYLFKKHHLFEVNYRFGGIFGLISKKQDITAIVEDDIIYRDNLGYYFLNTQSYLTISYAYKF